MIEFCFIIRSHRKLIGGGCPIQFVLNCLKHPDTEILKRDGHIEHKLYWESPEYSFINEVISSPSSKFVGKEGRKVRF